VGLPEIEQGANLGALLAKAAAPDEDEVVVVSQKIVSKAEGRLRRLAEVKPEGRAIELAEKTAKDPRLVQLALEESRTVLRAERDVLICETNAGWVCANAGIDNSNVPEGVVALLPVDGDASARRIRAEIRENSGRSPAVLVADSFGRAWRLGQVEVALGCAGLSPLQDWRGRADAGGRELEATEIATADQLVAFADLVRDKDSGIPGAVISGLGHLVTPDDGPGAAALQRPLGEDLFR
jgi:coenzyme F420-0:L-glutamate ligase / coenzyme F420-1:gamma-L-glutamate ligase